MKLLDIAAEIGTTLAIGLVLAVAINTAHKINSKTKKLSDRTWINLDGMSYHIDRTKNYNEKNWGGGIEYQLDDTHAIVGGVIKNSFRQNTHYLAYRYTPIKIFGIRFGFLAGIGDGYKSRRNGGFCGAFGFLAAIDNKSVGVNIVLLPNKDFAIAFESKIKPGKIYEDFSRLIDNLKVKNVK